MKEPILVKIISHPEPIYSGNTITLPKGSVCEWELPDGSRIFAPLISDMVGNVASMPEVRECQ